MDATQQFRNALLDEANADAVIDALQRGADIHGIQGPDGEEVAALSWAIREAFGPDGSVRVVEALIAAGARVSEERPSDGSTSLHRAAELGYVRVIEVLLAADGRGVLGSFDYLSRTPLICAVHCGHLEAARLLIEAGSDVNAHDEPRIGNPALRWAVGEQNEEMVRLLLRAGADPQTPGWMQRSALDEATPWKQSRKPHLVRIFEVLDMVARNPSSRRSLR